MNINSEKQIKMKKSCLFITLIIFSNIVFGQVAKRALTHDDILKWERIRESLISNDGKTIVYKQEPWKGDPTLKITTPKAKEIVSIKCGTDAKITADSKFVIFTIKPEVDSVRNLKLKKTKKEDLPKDKLAIFNIKDAQTDTIDDLVSVKVPEKWSGWIAYQSKAPKDTTEKKKSKDNGKADPLFILNLNSGEKMEFPDVADYVIAKEKEALVFISESKDSTFEAGVYFVDLVENETIRILDGKGEIKQLTIDKKGKKIAFVADMTEEDKEEEKNFSLYFWDGQDKTIAIADNSNTSLPENWEISENGSLSFSENGKRLFLGTAPKKAAKDTTKLEEEIPMLDIWHWQDEDLQTTQLVRKKRDEKKSYEAVVHLESNKLVQLETELFTGFSKINKGDADKILASSYRPYAVQAMWEGSPRHNDFYLVDIETGEAEMIKKDIRASASVSPEGNYLYWYNAVDTSWNTYHIESGKEYKVTTPDVVQAANELHDTPNMPYSYRMAGWTKEDESILIYDRFDIWKVDPQNNSEPINITQNGRDEKISYRLVRFDLERGTRSSEQVINTEEPLFLTGTNIVTRADGYYTLDLNKQSVPDVLLLENFNMNSPKKAKDADVIVFTKEDFQTYPDLIASDLSFKKQEKISDVAPQQKDFLWGTAELVKWTSYDGLELEGTLHKPENFDPNKKYPMIVNFYEKSSQGLLRYRMPEIGRSTIDYHWYTSNGYIIFNPDVYYTEGYPGESAFNCVMPGITALIKQGFVDEDHIGAQGHSWGGYQVAYLATRTNLFAAIESGAPVVNMFSAYGGIRWTSGLNRSFQYENTQSRIGKTIWESPLRYIENSPLFTFDKIETPILIMHNDDDGAVPWYQGIEFFIGLRRLQKPVWMLNYNEADHWPTKLRDKEDFQIRMAQFFDHYLKEKPMPKWMKEGVPAVKKGIEMGYELVE